MNFCPTFLSCAELLEHPVSADVMFPMIICHHRRQDPVCLGRLVPLVLLVLPVPLVSLVLLVFLVLMELLV